MGLPLLGKTAGRRLQGGRDKARGSGGAGWGEARRAGRGELGRAAQGVAGAVPPARLWGMEWGWARLDGRSWMRRRD